MTPLVLDYLVVNNRTNSLPASSTTPLSSNPNSSDSTSTPSGTAADLNHPNRAATNKIGPIVGGTVGGMALILIAIVGALWFRKWDRTQRARTPAEDLPKEYIVDPFQYNPEAATTIVPPRRPPPPPVERTRQKLRDLSGSDPVNEDPFSPLRQAGPSSSDARHTMHQATIARKRRLAREAAARAAALRQSSSTTSPSQSISPSVGSTGSAPLIVHEDSGIRLPGAGVGNTIEIPPIYTVG